LALKVDGWWPTFKAHYTKRGAIEEHRAWSDLATWPPIASRVMELRLAQVPAH
jgi:hypothetical protein